MSKKRFVQWMAFTVGGLILVGAVYLYLAPAHGVMDTETPLWDLRTLSTAIVTYQNEYDSFPPTLSALGPPKRGEKKNATAAGLVNANFASGKAAGYTFTYRAVDSRGKGRLDSFTITADPLTSHQNGLPHYFMDETLVIRSEYNSPARAKSPQVN